MLAPSDLATARDVAGRARHGDRISQADLDSLGAEWEPKLQPRESDRREKFSIVRPDGVPTGVHGPRWLFHLFGLRHRAAEIALATPTGLIVLQRRSPTKSEWPGALDMAVAGHVSTLADGTPASFLTGAWKEMAEEIGLAESDAEITLVEGGLAAIGEPYFCLDADPARNPPFIDAEVRQVFAATLTGAGLARLNFADGEVAGLLLVATETAWEILKRREIASGLRYSLPRYLDWLERQSGQQPPGK